MGCDHCHAGFHKRDYKNGATICVADDAEYDCQVDTATGRPQGPDGCMRCFMVGDESMCGECDHANGFDMDMNSMTCYERLNATAGDWYEHCNADMEMGCSICKGYEKVDPNTNTIVHGQFCEICKSGFMMTDYGMCVDTTMDHIDCTMPATTNAANTGSSMMTEMYGCMPGMC
jgi:hypothetical protein